MERRTQAERTATTRTALLDAAAACLAERGYAGTTTTEVARRAGVSRGAQLHHFPTKADLLLAATAHVLDRRLGQFRKAFADVDPGTDRIDAAIDVMWSMYAGGTFAAYLELLLAARTDDTLRPAVLDQQQRFFQGATEVFREVLGDSLATDRDPDPDPEADADAVAVAVADPDAGRLGLAFAFALMDGVALAGLLGAPPPVPAGDVIGALKVVAHQFAPPTEDP